MVTRSVSSNAGLAEGMITFSRISDRVRGAHGLRRFDLGHGHTAHVFGHHQHHLKEGAQER